MSVSVRVPTILRAYTGGAAEVATEPGTLREVLARLDASYPGLGGRILDDDGRLRRFVNVYVGEEDVRLAQGQQVTRELIELIIGEELAKIKEQSGAAFDTGRYEQAIALFTEVALADDYAEFLTIPAYERMP